MEAGDAGIAGEVCSSQVTGRVGVVDGEDLRLSTTGGGLGRGRRGALGTALGEGEAVGGAA